MASFSHLAPELPSHILKLSTEGEPAKERQRFRLAFGLISRAFFLATADATEFHVDNEHRAKALVAQLEREKEWVAQEESKATSRRTSHSATLSVTRVSKIRHLSLLIDTGGDNMGFIELIHAAPALLRLDLLVDFSVTSISAGFENALGRLKDLRHLRLRSMDVKFIESINPVNVLRSLTPLKTLEVLDLEIRDYWDRKTRLEKLALPHLRKLRIELNGRADHFSTALLAVLAGQSTKGIEVLDLQQTIEGWFFPETLIPLCLVANVRRFILAPNTQYGPVEDGVPAAISALLGAMTSLVWLESPMWITNSAWNDRMDCEGVQQLDLTLLDTLTALPSLQSVHLIAKQGHLSHTRIISYFESQNLLASFSIKFCLEVWTRGEQDAVEDAADRAGIAFSYATGFTM
ncbi:hypothetical protein RQP46_008038 [Phenoliferia psychrophenolica]